MTLKIQTLRLDSIFINRISTLLATQTWEIVSTFLNDIGITFKNCGLAKTHLILLGLFTCWCSGNNEKSHSARTGQSTLSTSKDTGLLPTEQIGTKSFPWKTGTSKRVPHVRQQPHGSDLSSATVPPQQDTRKIPLQLLCTRCVKRRHTRNIYHDFAHDKQGSGFKPVSLQKHKSLSKVHPTIVLYKYSA